jgi:GT2 family glycosyltransferase
VTDHKNSEFDDKKVNQLVHENKVLKRKYFELSAKFSQAQALYADYAETNIKYIFYHNQFKKHPIYRFDRWLRSLETLFIRRHPEKVAGESRQNSPYLNWINAYDLLSLEDKNKINSAILDFNHRPIITIYLFVGADEISLEKRLANTFNSLEIQLYTDWELVIVHLGKSSDSLIYEFKNNDKVSIIDPEAGYLSNETILSNIEDKSNGYSLFLFAGDQLSETALYELTHEINLNLATNLIYTDEDKISFQGERYNPFFKSNWNEELFLGQNYINRSAVVHNAQIINQLNKFEPGEKFDLERLMFKIATQAGENEISHVPSVLFHLSNFDPPIEWVDFRRNKDFVTEVLDERQISHVIDLNNYNPDWLHVRRCFKNDENPLVSILIPTRNNYDLFYACVNGILNKTRYGNYEIIIIDHMNDEMRSRSFIETLATRQNVKVIPYDKPFNYSDMNNAAASHAKGDILLLMNDDVEVLKDDWLDEIVGHFADDKCGIVGAKLLFSKRTIQHAGIACGYGGVAGHPLSGASETEIGYFGRLVLATELSAVTGACLAIRKNLYHHVEGMNGANFRKKFNDVDLCLKIGRLGYKIIWTPYAVLLHHESCSLGIDDSQEQFASLMQETKDMMLSWPIILDDPYYNPNLSILAPGYELAFPPRRIKPWNVLLPN